MRLPTTAATEYPMNRDGQCLSEEKSGNLTELKIFVPDELARAWQRCSWLLVNENDRERTDIMEEMVKDFLSKHGC